MPAVNLADDWPPLRTLTDVALRHWNLRVTCQACRHVRILHGAALWWLFHRNGWPDDLPSAFGRLSCTRCRAARRDKLRPAIAKTKEDVSGSPLPLPPDHEWKRLVARYRS